ncbi:MAG: hypothetical protein A2Y25_00275 [Candidatus Melainabacteria bacterium GWF2_37_15]|nr:MAG: hypothetical protein A2Y25_00275 [Candidatus Melainabacteria bacterium GWF2_37_15]
MKKLIVSLCLVSFMCCSISPAFAGGRKFDKGGITGKTVVAGALSLIIWPGIGQAVNDEKGDKVLTHAVVGLLPPFRVWSCYDALVDRKGGYWEGKI